ncbi:MAG: DUF2079 domain-containing protein [Anaerolineae bacterium]
MRRPSAPQAAVGLLLAAYVAIFGTLSIRRHQNLHTNALDLGYTDQAVWNTLHGRPFRFSTYLDAAFRLDIPVQEFREPDILLGYHVEPILVPISLLYLLYDCPQTLLWLQTLALALGALPIYLLARLRFAARQGDQAPAGLTPASRAPALVSWLPVAFVALYLLSPPLEAANLSDFHAVALAPVLLLAAFYCLETKRNWGFVAFAFLAVMCKEEIGLVVAMMGLWAALFRRRRILGLGTGLAALCWSLLSFLVIMPHFNGLAQSAFVVRYSQFGETPLAIAHNLLTQPRLLVDWLGQPAVLRYLRDLWLSSGGLAILYPAGLLMALPSLAVNAFSRFAWMRSGGGHYSVVIVPFLTISAIYGLDWVARWPQHRARASAVTARARALRPLTSYTAVATFLVVAGLAVALVHHYDNGISPLSRRFALEPVTEHSHRARPLFERVNALPADVAVSASSGLYPHVAHRELVYLFPTVSDAQYVLVDVTGPGTPAPAGEQYQLIRELLDQGQFGLADSDDGFLLLARDVDNYRLSPTFDDVFLASVAEAQVPVSADFAGLLRLQGFDRQVRPVVRPELVVQIATYWQALTPLDEELRLVFYFWDERGRLLSVQPEQSLVHWYPTWLWEPGQQIKVTLPPLPVGDLPHVGVAALRPGTAELDTAGRLSPITSSREQPLSLWDQGTVVELVNP